jgi:DNA-binding NtrC family response regulator
MSRAHVLVVDDEPAIRETVADILGDEGYTVTTAENASAARAARRSRRPDLILLDVWMPDTDGISLLKEWAAAGGLDQPVVMMSGHGTVETAVEATRLGAYDFIEKPLSLARLLLMIERALEASALKQENTGLRKQLVDAVPEPAGSSKLMLELRAAAERVAGHDAWVLISGEPGTGKESLARYIHAHSARAERPFIAVAPGMIARSQAAIELFGSEAAGELRYGLIERAQGGCLFIDEVADLDAELQLMLVSALSRKQLTRVGGQQAVALDIRVMAASSRDLEAEVRGGRFREDLLYQLRVVPLRIPALRERAEDIPELVRQLAETLPQRERLPYRRFAIAAQNRLRQHGFPGNLRELRNLMQRLLIMGSSDEVDAAEVELALGGAVATGTAAAENGHALPAHLLAVDLSLPMREARELFEREYLLHQLKLAGGSVGKLSRNVGLERTHLYRKLRALGVELGE